MVDANQPENPPPMKSMAELVGPFYTGEPVGFVLGCAERDLEHQVSQGRPLAVQTPNGVDLYPTFQFNPRGGVRDVIVPALSPAGRCTRMVLGCLAPYPTTTRTRLPATHQ